MRQHYRRTDQAKLQGTIGLTQGLPLSDYQHLAVLYLLSMTCSNPAPALFHPQRTRDEEFRASFIREPLSLSLHCILRGALGGSFAERRPTIARILCCNLPTPCPVSEDKLQRENLLRFGMHKGTEISFSESQNMLQTWSTCEQCHYLKDRQEQWLPEPVLCSCTGSRVVRDSVWNTRGSECVSTSNMLELWPFQGCRNEALS